MAVIASCLETTREDRPIAWTPFSAPLPSAALCVQDLINAILSAAKLILVTLLDDVTVSLVLKRFEKRG